MHNGPYGEVLDAEDINRDMLPEAGSKWLDTYAATTRRIIVQRVVWNPWASTEEVPVWNVECKEDYGWGRMFHISAHGFLSRYKKME